MTNFKYIVWVGGTPNYFKQKIDAEINGNYWNNKGYTDIIIEKI